MAKSDTPTTPGTPLPATRAGKPTVGRIVHYIEESGAETAAIVARVVSGTMVNLRTFPDSNLHHLQSREDVNEGTVPGCWRWPVVK